MRIFECYQMTSQVAHGTTAHHDNRNGKENPVAEGKLLILADTSPRPLERLTTMLDLCESSVLLNLP